MKKILFIVFLFLAISITYGQNATLKVTTNGIAPIARFTLNKPAALLFVNTQFAKNWEFDPDMTFDLSNGNGWFLDTWVKRNFKIDSAGKFTVTLGIDWSLFFQQYIDGKKVVQSVVYPTFEYMMRYVFNEKNSVTFDDWYTFATQKEYGVKGTYCSLQYSRTQPFKKITLTGSVTSLYINYSDGSKGYGNSYEVSVSHPKTGLFFGGQLIHSLTSVEKTGMQFGWNVSLGVTRKIF